MSLVCFTVVFVDLASSHATDITFQYLCLRHVICSVQGDLTGSCVNNVRSFFDDIFNHAMYTSL